MGEFYNEFNDEGIIDDESVKSKKESIEKLKKFSKETNLDQIFSNSIFANKIREAGRHTKETNNESGFNIYLKDNGELYFSDMLESDTSSVKQDTMGNYQKMYGSADSFMYNSALEIVDFHFHPDAIGSICPSTDSKSGDLHSLIAGKDLAAEETKIRFNPIFIIGQIDKKDKIKLLVIQRNNNEIDFQKLSYINDTMKQDTINKILIENGFNAKLIEFDKKNYNLKNFNFRE